MTMTNQTGERNASAADPAEELNGALGSSETEFVTPTEPKSRNNSLIVLGALLVIGPVVLWFMYHRKGPDGAEASVVTSRVTEAHQTVTNFLDNGPAGMKMMEQMLRGTEKIVKQFLDYPSVKQVPLSELKTNPFRAAKTEVVDNDANDKKRREQERQAVVKAVAGLQVQSIISGKNKSCMINNRLCQEGQQIESFTIEKINPGAVIVKSGAYRFELKMRGS